MSIQTHNTRTAKETTYTIKSTPTENGTGYIKFIMHDHDGKATHMELRPTIQMNIDLAIGEDSHDHQDGCNGAIWSPKDIHELDTFDCSVIVANYIKFAKEDHSAFSPAKYYGKRKKMTYFRKMNVRCRRAMKIRQKNKELFAQSNVYKFGQIVIEYLDKHKENINVDAFKEFLQNTLQNFSLK